MQKTTLGSSTRRLTTTVLMNTNATAYAGAATIARAGTTPQFRREESMLALCKRRSIQGYLAYYDGKIVGWCNANTKSDCLKCVSWRRMMGYVPLDDVSAGLKVKSIFCFVIAPEMRRKGIATLLLERVCQDAAEEGFDLVEAYPYKSSSWQSSDFGGYLEMYQKEGFGVCAETDQGVVVRKSLR